VITSVNLSRRRAPRFGRFLNSTAVSRCTR
jgi:hypothetical protein